MDDFASQIDSVFRALPSDAERRPTPATALVTEVPIVPDEDSDEDPEEMDVVEESEIEPDSDAGMEEQVAIAMSPEAPADVPGASSADPGGSSSAVVAAPPARPASVSSSSSSSSLSSSSERPKKGAKPAPHTKLMWLARSNKSSACCGDCGSRIEPWEFKIALRPTTAWWKFVHIRQQCMQKVGFERADMETLEVDVKKRPGASDAEHDAEVAAALRDARAQLS